MSITFILLKYFDFFLQELSDKDSESIKPLRQLLPFSKVQVDIIVTTATSMIIDSKGNRVQSFEFVDKKPVCT